MQNKRQLRKQLPFVLAAGEGFEPSQTESESVVLPLHNPAIFALSREHECYYIRSAQNVKHIFPEKQKNFVGVQYILDS